MMCFIRLTRSGPTESTCPELRLACDTIESMHYNGKGRTTVCLASGRTYDVTESIPAICERIDEAIIRQQRMVQQRKGLT